MLRRSLLHRLAFADYCHEARLSACAVLALVAVLAPLLVLFGLKFGLVSTLTERLARDPAVREIVPLGGGRYSAAQIAELAVRKDVAFALPRTRQIAATADLYPPKGGLALTVEMIPTAKGDPLLAGLSVPEDLSGVVLSQTAAEQLGVKVGDELSAAFGRLSAGKPEYRRTALNVIGIVPLNHFGRDALFAALPLLEAAEDYRDGLAVAALGWPGKEPGATAARIYPGFRLYAQAMEDVEGLRQHFASRGEQVQTQAEAIANVRSLSRNLSLVFWIIAGLGIAGALASLSASAIAAVERKHRELSVLRLIGLSSLELTVFPVLQALYTGAAALVLSFMLYALAQLGLNRLFAQAAGEYAALLMPGHYLVAMVATLPCTALAAAAGGWRAARIEASDGLRDV